VRASAKTSGEGETSYGEVWRLAWPMILAGASTPLLGLADTAVIGNTASVAALGAIAVGALIFNFVYWAFGFLRMGTTGLTAQAVGARDEPEIRANLRRAGGLALMLGLGLILLQIPIASLAFWLMPAGEEVEALSAVYFDIRIWGAPSTLAVYAVTGWFIGLQDTRTVLVLQVFLNLLNIALNVLFVVGFEMGVAGVALGTVLAEYAALGLALVLIRLRTARFDPASRPDWSRVLRPEALVRLVSVNRDIMIRTLFLISAFAFFTAQGAEHGQVTLAANHVLLQFLAFAAFFLDGFAFASEAIVGKAVGARSQALLTSGIRRASVLAAATACGLSLVFLLLGSFLIDALSDQTSVREAARAFLPFAAAHPVLAVAAFQLDGVFIGATRTSAMRNTMIAAFALYLGAWAVFTEVLSLGNTGLWLAFLAFFLARGALLYAVYGEIRGVVGKASS